MNTEIIALLKDKFKEFINSIENLSAEDKRLIVEKMGSNWYDARFEVETLASEMDKRFNNHKIAELKSHMTNQVTFWEEVCKAAAQHSAKPNLIADAALKSRTALRQKFI